MTRRTHDIERFYIGLDLGQAQDFTALCVLQYVDRINTDPTDDKDGYFLRYLHRYDLGTTYPDIVNDVVRLIGWLNDGKERALGIDSNEVRLVIDMTGVGRAVFDLFSDAIEYAKLIGVSITSGNEVSGNHEHHITRSDRFNTPKKELVSTLQALYQTKRIRTGPDIEHIDTLNKELLNFKAKITTAGNETFGAWREKDHDDLVLALALAAWFAEFTRCSGWKFVPKPIGRAPTPEWLRGIP